jgi:hypothetical protein|tara:strand:- start:79 stop:354 length:276 start_codon:yes stop_codon:yes gene_type:complete
MRFDASAMIPIVTKLGKFLRGGFDQYVELKSSGIEPTPEMISMFVGMKMADWNPKIRGSDLMDDETRSACARFVGGVAYNIALAQRKGKAA